MAKRNQKVFICGHCEKICSRKKSHVINSLNNYCSRKCYMLGRTKDINRQKEKIINLYEQGLTALEISKKLGIKYGRQMYHLKKWGLEIKKCYDYKSIMDEIGKKRRKITEKDFLQRYKDGKVSWRQTHRIAQRIWKITQIPCEVCNWAEVERDMHLIIPRLLEKNNAVSLCPNCHRLTHRGKLKLSRENNSLIVVKI